MNTKQLTEEGDEGGGGTGEGGSINSTGLIESEMEQDNLCKGGDESAVTSFFERFAL